MSEIGELLRKLHKDKICVSSEWLEQCVEYIKEHIKPPKERLLLEIQEMWLGTDISEAGVMKESAFPPNICAMQSFPVTGSVALQVNYGIDIGNSSYSQLQKLYKLENENARVSADVSEDTQSGYQPSQGRFVASWEPKPSRMLKLALTDGFQTIEAVEHQRIDALDSVIKPGMKIQLFGPFKIKKGKIFLVAANVRVLGGSVEELQDKFSGESVLSQRVGKRVDGPAYPFLKGMPKRPQLDLTRLSQQPSSRPGSSQTQPQGQVSRQHNTAPFGMGPPQIPGNSGIRQPTPSQFGAGGNRHKNLAASRQQNHHQALRNQNPNLTLRKQNPNQDSRNQNLNAASSQQNNDDLKDIDLDDDDFPDDDFPDDDFLEDDAPILNARNIPAKPNTASSSNNQQFKQPQNNNFRPPLRNISLPNKPNSAPPINPNTRTSPQDHMVKSAEVKPRSIVRPLARNETNVTSSQSLPSSSQSAPPKKTIQTSISSFMSSKRPREDDSDALFGNDGSKISIGKPAPISVPDFDLGADDELFDDLDMDVGLEQENMVQAVSSDPFVYLCLVKQELKQNPTRQLEVSVKAVSATLVRGLKVVRSGPDGQATWNIGILINDGSDFMEADMKGGILEKDLGSPSQYLAAQKAGDKQVKMEFKGRMSELSKKIAVINGIVRLRFNGDGGTPNIVDIQELTGLHLAKLRRRKYK